MLTCGNNPIGVCSWSLQMAPQAIRQAMNQLDIRHIHLDLRPWCIDQSAEYLDFIRRADWTISSTMIGFPQEDYTTLDTIRVTGGIVPDACWDRNKEIFLSAVKVTAELKAKYLSAHIGFIDHTDIEGAQKLLDRVRFMADQAASKGITLLMETGQETAEQLKQFLEQLNHPAIGVNFDPANMILYNQGNPIDAVDILGPWIRHVHIKDAKRTAVPGTWGSEVAWSRGDVQADRFIQKLRQAGYKGVLAIEREAGDQRLTDIEFAVRWLSQL